MLHARAYSVLLASIAMERAKSGECVVGSADLRGRAEGEITAAGGFTDCHETIFTGWEEAYEDCGEGDGWGAPGRGSVGYAGPGSDELLHPGIFRELQWDVQHHTRF